MEDGEIGDNTQSNVLEQYDPSFEWPSESSSTPLDDIQSHGTQASKSTTSWVTLRLLVTQTSILPRRQKLAIVDGYTELQFGRDVALVGTSTPRIRLKEMPVSKLHATAYWDGERREWGVVDMGSKHGTFIRSATSSGDVPLKDVRLSPPRMASVPRQLRHLDLLMIGSTSFLIHIHEDRVPCIECSSDGDDEIPLFAPSKSAKRTRDLARIDEDATVQRDAKKALTMLKRSLLKRHDESISPSEGPTTYVDRSARRRALHPGMSVDCSSRPVMPADVRSRPVEPPAPLLASNIGHRLLIKQGWQPGTPLGADERVGLVEPLGVNPISDRQGIGMRRDSSDWKQKRWQSLLL